MTLDSFMRKICPGYGSRFYGVRKSFVDFMIRRHHYNHLTRSWQ